MFASRYGWEVEKILTVPADIFLGQYVAIKQAKEKEFKDGLKAAAFTAWRFEATLTSMFGGQAKESYPDYCEKHGLLTEKEKKQNKAMKRLQKTFQRMEAEQGKTMAEKIIAADREYMKNQGRKGD